MGRDGLTFITETWAIILVHDERDGGIDWFLNNNGVRSVYLLIGLSDASDRRQHGDKQ